jgi:hypothetical protein
MRSTPISDLLHVLTHQHAVNRWYVFGAVQGALRDLACSRVPSVEGTECLLQTFLVRSLVPMYDQVWEDELFVPFLDQLRRLERPEQAI